MCDSPLNIVMVGGKPSNSNGEKKLSRQEETKARLERMWLIDPEQFNPLRNARERERIERTLRLIEKHLSLKDKSVTDLGCGYGEITRKLRDAGAKVLAIDAASNALKKTRESGAESIELKQDCLPFTKLEDSAYDLVVCTDVIAYLHPNDFRLFFSELSRLVKPEGFVVCSTPLDIYSENALERFSNLAETEFRIESWSLSYHYLNLKLFDFFKAPSNFYKGWKDQGHRKQQLQERSGLGKIWYQFNSLMIPAHIWLPISWLCKPLCYALEQNRYLLLKLEKICNFFWDKSGISHAIFMAHRRPLEEPTKKEINEMKTNYRPPKRHVWE